MTQIQLKLKQNQQNQQLLINQRFQVVDIPSLWKWVDNVLVPGLYDVTWYNGQPFQYKEGYISNKQTFMMGMPRIRQLRIKKGEAAVSSRYIFPIFILLAIKKLTDIFSYH